MTHEYVRTGELMQISSYPQWLQEVVEECREYRRQAAQHELYQRMKAGELPHLAARNFFVGVWPVIEQFPQYMALNLLKVKIGRRGDEMARRYLIRNIRVEQNHVDLWIDWAEAEGVTREELLEGPIPPAAEALSHWCWHTCERDSLAAAMAATNYAIEGATGEWAAMICAAPRYEETFSTAVRRKAMRWLKAHAEYDDKHPWEALEIVATLLGNQPATSDVQAINLGIRKSYQYMQLTLDDCLSSLRDSRPLRAAFVGEAA